MAKQKITVPGLILFAIAIIIFVIQNPEQAVDTGESLVNAGEIFVDEVCPIPDRIIEILDENFIQSLDNEESKKLAELIKSGKATECDKLQFFELLDGEQRKRINWLEFVCNAKDCIKN